ncbi:MAG: hypothetical protein QXN05_02940 [Acidilobaceae archaeon]
MTVVKVIVTKFGRRTLKVGPVKLSVLEPIEVRSEQFEGDIIEVLARISESEVFKEGVVYVVAEIIGTGARLVYGDAKERGKEKALFPRPAKLLEVGAVRISSLKYDQKLGGVVFRENDVEWHVVTENVYVFDSCIEVEEGVAFVVLKTDLGKAVVKTLDLSKSELFSQLQEKRAEEFPLGEIESNEGSNPS